MAVRVFRVTIRGRFRDLSPEARARLVAAQPDHDVFLARYTHEGSFTYDERIQFFNLRYEVRADDAELAGVTAQVEAETFLRVLGYAHHPDLKVDVVDATAVWDDADRRRPAHRR
ncbi:MAG: DUF6204 family protein [Acidimicrobiales bacterium]